MNDMEWIVELVRNPTREGVLELASTCVDIAEAYSALCDEHEAYIDDDLAEAEETLVLLEKTSKVLRERTTEHRQATSAVEAVRKGLAIEQGSVKQVAGEIEALFAPKSKIDKRIAELIDGLLDMHAKKGKVDIMTKLVTIQKIKLCARGESVEKKR
jgi:hypothetical protein